MLIRLCRPQLHVTVTGAIARDISTRDCWRSFKKALLLHAPLSLPDKPVLSLSYYEVKLANPHYAYIHQFQDLPSVVILDQPTLYNSAPDQSLLPSLRKLLQQTI